MAAAGTGTGTGTGCVVAQLPPSRRFDKSCSERRVKSVRCLRPPSSFTPLHLNPRLSLFSPARYCIPVPFLVHITRLCMYICVCIGI